MAFSHLWSTPCNFTFWPAERTDFRLFYSWNPIHRHQCIILWLFFLLPEPFGDRFVGSCRVFFFTFGLQSKFLHLQSIYRCSPRWACDPCGVLFLTQRQCVERNWTSLFVLRGLLWSFCFGFRLVFQRCHSLVGFSSRCIKTCYCCLWFNRKGFLRDISSR